MPDDPGEAEELIEVPEGVPVIVAALPVYDMMYTRFLRTYIEAAAHVAGMISVGGAYVADNFNEACREFLMDYRVGRPGWRYTRDPEWLMFLEQDMEPPRGWTESVRSYQEPGVYGGLYFSRHANRQIPIAGSWDAKRHQGTPLSDAQVDAVVKEPGLYEVDWVGMGCTFIHRRVLEEWHPCHEAWVAPEHDRPWCAAHFPWFQNGIGPEIYRSTSHDQWFCWHAKAQGWPVVLDSRIRCDHMGITPHNYDTHLRWRQGSAVEPPAPALNRAQRRAAARSR